MQNIVDKMKKKYYYTYDGYGRKVNSKPEVPKRRNTCSACTVR